MDKMSEWTGLSIMVNDMSVEEMALCTCENSTFRQTTGLTRLHCGTPLIINVKHPLMCA